MAKRETFERATARAKELHAVYPKAVAARFDRRLGRVMIRLSTGLDVGFAPTDAQGLEHARPAHLADIEISPSGFGLRFPKIDADIYLPALLEGFFGTKKWAAARLGARGGRATSHAKMTSSRSNGKLGGRPRKVA